MPCEVQSLDILGVRVSAVDMDSAVEILTAWLGQDRWGRYVCVTGVHGVMESYRNPVIRAAHNNADACVPDGMPLSWFGWLKGCKGMDRVYGPDLMLRLMAVAEQRGLTSFLYGGREGVAPLLQRKLCERFPAIKIAGTYSPPFGPLSKDE